MHGSCDLAVRLSSSSTHWTKHVMYGLTPLCCSLMDDINVFLAFQRVLELALLRFLFWLVFCYSG